MICQSQSYNFLLNFSHFINNRFFLYTYFSFAFVLKKDPKLALRISFDSHGITLAFLS